MKTIYLKFSNGNLGVKTLTDDGNVIAEISYGTATSEEVSKEEYDRLLKAQKDSREVIKEQAAEDAAQLLANKESSIQSARGKLAALGLNEEEISAIVGS